MMQSKALDELKSPLVKSGFHAISDDFSDIALDLNSFLIKSPSSTYFFRTSGRDMHTHGIYDGDILVIDKAKALPRSGLVLLVQDDSFLVRHVQRTSQGVQVVSSKESHMPLSSDTQIWGVVTSVIRKFY